MAANMIATEFSGVSGSITRRIRRKNDKLILIFYKGNRQYRSTYLIPIGDGKPDVKSKESTLWLGGQPQTRISTLYSSISEH